MMLDFIKKHTHTTVMIMSFTPDTPSPKRDKLQAALLSLSLTTLPPWRPQGGTARGMRLSVLGLNTIQP